MPSLLIVQFSVRVDHEAAHKGAAQSVESSYAALRSQAECGSLTGPAGSAVTLTAL